jgi:hypothetical protein
VSISAGVSVTGTKEVLLALRQIDPEMRKQFDRDAKQIAAPIVEAAKQDYPEKYLSGMSRNWSQRGRQLFPYTQSAARRGVSVKVSTAKKNQSVIKITQRNAAASIIEVAGSARRNPKGDRFNTSLAIEAGQPSRVMWPSADRHLPQVTAAIEDLVRTVAARIGRQRELK